jgi:WD40 repeat protein
MEHASSSPQDNTEHQGDAPQQHSLDDVTGAHADQLHGSVTWSSTVHQPMEADQSGDSSNRAVLDGPRTPHNSVREIITDDNLLLDDDENVDDTPDFILNPDDVEEVHVDDDAEPMDEDEDDDNQADDQEQVVVNDMSKVQIHIHTGHVYAVATYYDSSTSTLQLLSGGGDDKAFWHQWAVVAPAAVEATAPTSMQLSYAHTDSVSCVAFNLPYLSPPSTTPEETSDASTRYLAVGAYDGAIIIYDADTQQKVQEFEGPSDVEWLCFHPKGGTVRAIEIWIYSRGDARFSHRTHLDVLYISRLSWLDLLLMEPFGCIIFL